MKLTAGMVVRQKGNPGATRYTLVSKTPGSSKWVCSYTAKGHNVGFVTNEVRISVLELHRDFETL